MNSESWLIYALIQALNVISDTTFHSQRYVECVVKLIVNFSAVIFIITPQYQILYNLYSVLFLHFPSSVQQKVIFSDIKDISSEHRQLAAAMENLMHIFAVPEEVQKAQKLIEEGKLLEVNLMLLYSGP